MVSAIMPITGRVVPSSQSKEVVNSRVAEALKSRNYFRCGALFGVKAQLARDIKEIRAADLFHALRTFFVDLTTKDVDSIKAAKELAKVIPLEKLQEAVKVQYPTSKEALEAAKSMVHQAKYYLEKTKNSTSPTWRARLHAIFDKFISILESILGAFGIAEFFKKSSGAMHSSFKFERIMAITNLFLMLTTVLLPLLGVTTGIAIIGGVLLGVMALSIIYPYFRPIPSALPRAENWSQQCEQGKLTNIEGRKSVVDEIAATLISSKDLQTHPLLIGKTGVGKTITTKSLVHAIERGDYPELKGKKVHYLNAANLTTVKQFEWDNDVMQRISEEMGSHRKDIILVIDEIHLLCRKGKNGVLGEQLKTMLDEGQENFPFVIGITTEEEYLTHIYESNSAFARRFKRINVENTNKKETKRILRDTCLQNAPHLFLEKKLFSFIQGKVPEGCSEPFSSRTILTQCITRIAESQKSPLEKKVEEKRSQIKNIAASLATNTENILLPSEGGDNEQIAKLERELVSLLNDLENERAERQHLAKKQREIVQVKKETFETVLKAAQFTPNLSHREKELLSTFLLLSHFLAPALESTIKKEGAKLHVRTEICKALVDEVVQEQHDLEAKAMEAIEKGKEKINDRKNLGEDE